MRIVLINILAGLSVLTGGWLTAINFLWGSPVAGQTLLVSVRGLFFRVAGPILLGSGVGLFFRRELARKCLIVIASLYTGLTVFTGVAWASTAKSVYAGLEFLLWHIAWFAGVPIAGIVLLMRPSLRALFR